MKRHEMGWAVGARLASMEMFPPHPRKKPRVSPTMHPALTAILLHGRSHKTSCQQRNSHKELFHIIFWEDLEPGLPRTHPWRTVDWPLTSYITTAKWKCHLFKCFYAQSEGQEVAEEIFHSKALKKLTQQQCSKLWDNLNIIHLTPGFSYGPHKLMKKACRN